MVILLFGVTGVGKTVTGKLLASKMKFAFYDMDKEIKKRYKMTLDRFMKEYPYPYERGKIKGRLLKDLMQENIGNMVIAVSPIFYSRIFNPLIKLDNVVAIELQDSVEHLFERMVFSDENDNIYRDDEYKNLHEFHYLKDIHDDIVYMKKIFSKIKIKYFIDNRTVEQVADDLILLIKANSPVSDCRI